MSATHPDLLGQNVEAHLADGTVIAAYWDGLTWWTGIEDNPDDVPIIDEFVLNWNYFI